jgi:hypothetical protein
MRESDIHPQIMPFKNRDSPFADYLGDLLNLGFLCVKNGCLKTDVCGTLSNHFREISRQPRPVFRNRGSKSKRYFSGF